MLDELNENWLHAKCRELFVEFEPHFPLALPVAFSRFLEGLPPKVAFTTSSGFTTIRAIEWHRKEQLEEQDTIILQHGTKCRRRAASDGRGTRISCDADTCGNRALAISTAGTPSS